MNIPGLLNAIGIFADEKLVGTKEDKFIAVDFHFATLLSSFLHPLRNLFRAAYQAGILSAGRRAEMVHIEQMKKIVESEHYNQDSSCQTTNPERLSGFLILSHCGTSAFYYHLNHGIIILKDIQHNIGTRMCHA